SAYDDEVHPTGGSWRVGVRWDAVRRTDEAYSSARFVCATRKTWVPGAALAPGRVGRTSAAAAPDHSRGVPHTSCRDNCRVAQGCGLEVPVVRCRGQLPHSGRSADYGDP